MTTINKDCELDRLYAEWSENRTSSEPNALKEWMARYPDNAEDLIQWTADAPVLDYAETLPADAEADVRALAIGKQTLSALRARLTSPVTVRPLVSLKEAARAAGLNLKTLAEQLGLGLPIVMKLEYRHLRVASLPATLIQQVADTLQVRIEEVRAYLNQSPTLAPGASYNAKDVVPQATAQEDFEQAVRACSNMTESQKKHWLNAL